MSDLHALRIEGQQTILERVGPKFVREGLFRARLETIHALNEIKAELREGMTELEARRLALRMFKDHGSIKQWHQPWIRFGSGTVFAFEHPLQTDYRLQPNDPYYMDLGPVWKDDELNLEYEGDYGVSLHSRGRGPPGERFPSSQIYKTRLIWSFLHSKRNALDFGSSHHQSSKKYRRLF